MSTFDTQLVEDVTSELYWDPKVDNADVTVTADDGRVTLTGTVGSVREKREAKKAAERVLGVISVDNQLRVKTASEAAREDAQLRDDVQNALMLAMVVGYLVQGVAIFDVLPMYIPLFTFLAFSNYYFKKLGTATN